MPSIITLGSASARAYGFEGLSNQIQFTFGTYEDPADQSQYSGFCYSYYYMGVTGSTIPNPPRVFSLGGLIVGSLFNKYAPNYGPYQFTSLTFPSNVSQTFCSKIIVNAGTAYAKEYLISAATYNPFDGSDTVFAWATAIPVFYPSNTLTFVK